MCVLLAGSRSFTATRKVNTLGILATLASTWLAAVPARSEERSYFEQMRDLERRAWTSQDSQLSSLENEVVRFIQIDPKNAYPFYLLSHIHLRKFTQSTENLMAIKVATDLAQQAVELEPRSDLGYIALAENLDIMGQGDRAVELLSNISTLGVEPTWRHYFTLARLHAQKIEVKQTLAYLEQALAFRNSEPEIIIPYVIAILQTNQSGQDLSQSLYTWDEKFPHNLFKQTIAMTLAEQGKFDKAHLIYSSIYKNAGNALEAKVNDAILLYRHLGKVSEGIKLFEDIIADKEHHKDLSEDLYAMVEGHYATALLKAKRFQDAEKHMLFALKLAPDQTAMLEFATKSFREHAQATRLPDFIKKLTFELKPTGLLYALLGESLSEDLAKHDDAVRSFANAIILDPTRSDYYNGMGLAFFRMQKLEEALNLFREASRVDPSDSSAIYNGACALARLGRTKESLGALQEAIQLDPQLASHAKADGDLKSLYNLSDFKRIITDASKAPKLDSDGDEIITGH